jgi:hypothetical protein
VPNLPAYGPAGDSFLWLEGDPLDATEEFPSKLWEDVVEQSDDLRWEAITGRVLQGAPTTSIFVLTCNDSPRLYVPPRSLPLDLTATLPIGKQQRPNWIYHQPGRRWPNYAHKARSNPALVTICHTGWVPSCLSSSKQANDLSTRRMAIGRPINHLLVHIQRPALMGRTNGSCIKV